MAVVKISVDDAEVVATIDDSVPARQFLSLLPMTLTLEDYNSTEKVSDLPERLSTEGEPEGLDPEVGDITYYAPWGNLAIFYRDFGYARGLIHLGKIESGVDLFKQKGPITVTIERAE